MRDGTDLIEDAGMTGGRRQGFLAAGRLLAAVMVSVSMGAWLLTGQDGGAPPAGGAATHPAAAGMPRSRSVIPAPVSPNDPRLPLDAVIVVVTATPPSVVSDQQMYHDWVAGWDP